MTSFSATAKTFAMLGFTPQQFCVIRRVARTYGFSAHSTLGAIAAESLGSNLDPDETALLRAIDVKLGRPASSVRFHR